ncbi:hypothetical protein MBANPS3_003754 [Mucor bainieri]
MWKGGLEGVVSPMTPPCTNDTSGNLSKQYNLFDSYPMTPAAYSFQDRGSKNNQYFICTANKTLSAVDMLPPLVDDLVSLEEGIEVYSISHREKVLLAAPLLFIQADNHRQSEMSMHMGSSARFCCRKCLLRKLRDPNPKPRKDASKATKEAYANGPRKEIPSINHGADPRKRHFLTYVRQLEDDKELKAIKDQCSCTKNGSQELLHLRAFDQTQDTPIEILHSPSLLLPPLLPKPTFSRIWWTTSVVLVLPCTLRRSMLSTRDVAVSFAKQFIVHHLLDGGSFLVEHEAPNGDIRRLRSCPGPSVTNFLNDAFPEFADKLFGSRENADNNDYLDSSLKHLQVGYAGVFTNDSDHTSFFARVSRQVVDDGCIKFYLQRFDVQLYHEIPASGFFGGYHSSLFPLFLASQEDNVVLVPREEEILFSAFHKLNESLDLDTPSPTGAQHRLLNIHKFDSLWSVIY